MQEAVAMVCVLKCRVSGNADVAQLVEQLIRNQQVIGSSPIAGSRIPNKSSDFAMHHNALHRFDPYLTLTGIGVESAPVRKSPRRFWQSNCR